MAAICAFEAFERLKRKDRLAAAFLCFDFVDDQASATLPRQPDARAGGAESGAGPALVQSASQLSTAGFRRSDRPTRCSISARRRSSTVKPTLAPSSVGS